MECSINSPALSLLMKHLVIGQRLKTHNFSAFHWSPCGSLVSIGQQFVATRVVHLPKSIETSLITESDQSRPDHQLLQLCTDSTAWSNLDQAVRAVHSCNSWFLFWFSTSNLYLKVCIGIKICTLCTQGTLSCYFITMHKFSLALVIEISPAVVKSFDFLFAI